MILKESYKLIQILLPMNLILNSHDTLDSDIFAIEEVYNKSDGGCFWIAGSIDYNSTQQQKIVGTTAVRKLKQFESTRELKRKYVINEFRRLGLGQKLLNIAIDFAKKHRLLEDGLE